MGTVIQGQANTTHLPVDLAQKSYAATIMRLFPNGPAPIWAITANMKNTVAKQFEHGYYTKSMVFPNFVIDGALDDTETTWTVVSTENLTPGQVFENPATLEQVLLLDVIDATTIEVRREVGTALADAVDDAQLFPCVGNAHEEGSDRPQSAIIMPERVINFTQIFRNTWALTDSLRATMTIAGDGNVAESRTDCGLFHASDMEKALIFGQRYSGTLNNKPLRKMDGIIESTRAFAPDNITIAGGTTNYSQLEAALDPVFNFQTDPKIGNERWLFVGSQALKVINKIGRLTGQYHIVDGQTSFGLRFSTFKISRGTFRMVEHPLLNTNPEWAKMALAIDFSSLSIAYLANRKTKSEEFGVNGKYVENGQDAVGGSLTTEMTAEIKNPYSNGVIYNLTEGVADA